MNADKLAPYEKYSLTIREAGAYFGIGIKRMRRLAENNEGEFAYYMGNSYYIIRPLFEQYLIGLAKQKKDGTEKTDAD